MSAGRGTGSLALRVAEPRRVVGGDGGDGDVGAAERAGGALVPEPGLEAAAVEEVPAGEPVHHGRGPEPRQAHAAVVPGRRRAARRRDPRDRAEPRRAEERPLHPLRGPRPRGGHEAVPAAGAVGLPVPEVEEHERRPDQPRQRRQRDHRVVDQGIWAAEFNFPRPGTPAGCPAAGVFCSEKKRPNFDPLWTMKG